MSSNDYTWDTRPAPGTLVTFAHDRKPYYYNNEGRQFVTVLSGDVAMILGYGKERNSCTFLLLRCGTKVALVTYDYVQLGLKPFSSTGQP